MHLAILEAYFRSLIFLLALHFTIFQASIAARTPTLMQGSEEKKRKSVAARIALGSDAYQTAVLTTTNITVMTLLHRQSAVFNSS